MQKDAKFNEAFDYLVTELRKSQLEDPQWLEKLSADFEFQLVSEFTKDPRKEFAEQQSIQQHFDPSSLKETVENLLADNTEGTVVNIAELRAVTLQLQFLLNLQRSYARRVIPRATRIVNAAWRRAILTDKQGPLQQRLRAAVEAILESTR